MDAKGLGRGIRRANDTVAFGIGYPLAYPRKYPIPLASTVPWLPRLKTARIMRKPPRLFGEKSEGKAVTQYAHQADSAAVWLPGGVRVG